MSLISLKSFSLSCFKFSLLAQLPGCLFSSIFPVLLSRTELLALFFSTCVILEPFNKESVQ